GSINRKFDRDLAYAIKKFRRSFNLKDGVYIDNKLLAYINLPKSYYIKKIIVNLDKTKVFLPSFGKTYIEVNIPEFVARFYQNGVEVFQTNAIVGSLQHPTPIFDDYLEYIVINPTWSVPDSIIKRALIPALKKYPNIFEIANLKAYQRGKEVKPNIKKLLSIEGTNRPSPYRIVQMPGPNNALGRVKFMFPNKYAVYLHDTPEKGLFAHRYRYNSSGCIRLQDPYGLLEHLRPYLQNPNYEKYLKSGKTYKIRLKRKIPVHIVYFTLEFEGGAPKFMYDAYMYDKMIEESTPPNIKYDFVMPEVRLIEAK
ncbi:MAG: L,D-transpeptidase family protein, partial [Epsilonproteobacteria bacterium]|nr:L,D-transpeptidase family protein [Campylobacterota bacterium]